MNVHTAVQYRIPSGIFIAKCIQTRIQIREYSFVYAFVYGLFLFLFSKLPYLHTMIVKVNKKIYIL